MKQILGILIVFSNLIGFIHLRYIGPQQPSDSGYPCCYPNVFEMMGNGEMQAVVSNSLQLVQVNYSISADKTILMAAENFSYINPSYTMSAIFDFNNVQIRGIFSKFAM